MQSVVITSSVLLQKTGPGFLCGNRQRQILLHAHDNMRSKFCLRALYLHWGIIASTVNQLVHELKNLYLPSCFEFLTSVFRKCVYLCFTIQNITDIWIIIFLSQKELSWANEFLQRNNPTLKIVKDKNNCYDNLYHPFRGRYKLLNVMIRFIF